MIKKIILFSLLLIISTSAQKKWKFWNDWDEDYFRWDHSKPLVEAIYGINKFDNKSFNGTFSETGMVGIKLGYSQKTERDDYLVRLRESFISFSNIAPKIHHDQKLKTYDAKMEMWQGGFGHRTGLGYSGDYFSFMPYNERSFNLLKIKQNPYPYYNFSGLTNREIAEDIAILERFDGKLKFSMQEAVGAKIEIANRFGITGNYEINTVYPTILTWKMFGSYSLQMGAYIFLDEFTEEIEDSAPEVAPIINVLLKGALNYTFYQLRKDKMNWPFESEQPLTYESFTVGLSLRL